MHWVRIAPVDGGHGLPLPRYHSVGAAGLDLHAAIDKPIILWPLRTVRVPCGVAFELPDGHEATIRPRSSTSSNGLLVHLGTIDADYIGGISATVTLVRFRPMAIRRGDRIAQIVISPIAQVKGIESTVESFRRTARGQNGFGSTGR